MEHATIPLTTVIALAAAVDAGALAALAEAPFTLRLLPGGRRLAVRYDLQRVDRAGVEAVLAAAGLALADGPWIRLRRRWAAFRENNLRSQAGIVHRCCSDPPD